MTFDDAMNRRAELAAFASFLQPRPNSMPTPRSGPTMEAWRERIPQDIEGKWPDERNLLLSRMSRDELVDYAANTGAAMGTIKPIAREGAQKIVSKLSDSWRQRGVDNVLSVGTDGGVTLSKVVVPKEQRGKGVGSAFMQELLSQADEMGVPVRLTPDGAFGGSVPRLKKFYKGFGFIENKGRNREFLTREQMYRNPSKAKR